MSVGRHHALHVEGTHFNHWNPSSRVVIVGRPCQPSKIMWYTWTHHLTQCSKSKCSRCYVHLWKGMQPAASHLCSSYCLVHVALLEHVYSTRSIVSDVQLVQSAPGDALEESLTKGVWQTPLACYPPDVTLWPLQTIKRKAWLCPSPSHTLCITLIPLQSCEIVQYTHVSFMLADVHCLWSHLPWVKRGRCLITWAGLQRHHVLAQWSLMCIVHLKPPALSDEGPALSDKGLEASNTRCTCTYIHRTYVRQW